MFLPHYLQPRPWDKPLYPTTWKLFRSNISNTHAAQLAWVPRTTATKYRNATYVEIPRSDHLVFVGESLPVTMSRIHDWLARNHVLSTA